MGSVSSSPPETGCCLFEAWDGLGVRQWYCFLRVSPPHAPPTHVRHWKKDSLRFLINPYHTPSPCSVSCSVACGPVQLLCSCAGLSCAGRQGGTQPEHQKWVRAKPGVPPLSLCLARDCAVEKSRRVLQRCASRHSSLYPLHPSPCPVLPPFLTHSSLQLFLTTGSATGACESTSGGVC